MIGVFLLGILLLYLIANPSKVREWLSNLGTRNVAAVLLILVSIAFLAYWALTPLTPVIVVEYETHEWGQFEDRETEVLHHQGSGWVNGSGHSVDEESVRQLLSFVHDMKGSETSRHTQLDERVKQIQERRNQTMEEIERLERRVKEEPENETLVEMKQEKESEVERLSQEYQELTSCFIDEGTIYYRVKVLYPNMTKIHANGVSGDCGESWEKTTYLGFVPTDSNSAETSAGSLVRTLVG